MTSNFINQMSEEAFVGCVIASEGNVISDFPVTAEHFVTPGAHAVFRSALELHQAGSPISAFTVSQRITDEQAKAMGGDHRVSEICFFPASIREAAHHFGIIDNCFSMRRARDIGKWIVQNVTEAEDAGEFITELQQKAAQLESEGDSENVLMSCLTAIRAKLDRMEAGKVDHGFQTRLAAWNDTFGGIMDGQLYGLAARPGLGKTALMEMFIGDYLSAGIPISVFEKDMSPQKLLERIACRICKVQFWAFAKGLVARDAYSKIRDVLDALEHSPLHLYNPANLTADRLCAIARRDIRTKGTKCVFLDHVQALRVGKDLRLGLTQASLSLRANVTDTGIPHFILAHINREGAKGGRPTPESIKDFDQLYGDADAMAILWREKDAVDIGEELIPVNLYAAKNRDGAVSELEILFDGKRMTFVDQAR